MSDIDIAPLAKRLAEENNVDWRRLEGSGAGGKIVERDVLGYLARVMAGEEDLDPTPEPLPEGMEEWPEEDIAAYRRGARERAASGGATPAGPPPGPSAPDEEIDEDIFLFEDEDFEATDQAEAAEPDVFAAPDAMEGEEDEDLFLDLPAAERSSVEAAGAASEAWLLGEEEEEKAEPASASGFDLGSMEFDVGEPDAPPSGGYAVERRDVPDLDIVGGEVSPQEPTPPPAPSSMSERAHPPQEAAPQAPQRVPVEEPEPARMVTRSTVDVTAEESGVPLVRYGHLFRRHVDLTAVEDAQASIGRELGHEEPIALSAFLVKAAAKALRDHPLGSGRIALGTVRDGLGFREVAAPLKTTFRELVTVLEQGHGSPELPEDVSLVVVDLSALGVDEAVLSAGAPVLALGRILYDDEAGGVRGTISLSGDVPPETGARLLAAVADLLATPVRLLI